MNFDQQYYPITKMIETEKLLLNLTRDDLTCPFCEEGEGNPTTWGAYKTEGGEIRRYYCYTCKKSFNPSKVPIINIKLGKIAYKLGKLAIQHNIPINQLAQSLNVPEKTLKTIITEIEQKLAENLEFIKDLQQFLNQSNEVQMTSLRVLYYDEGFHRLLGKQYYLVFAVDQSGIPVSVELVASRDQKAIVDCLETARSKMGGVDVIVSDGSPTILSAVRNLRSDVILVQHVHSDLGKRARIIHMTPVLGTKKIRELTIELHTGSLRFNTESIIHVQKKEFYPSTRKKKFQHQKDKQLKKKTKLWDY
jgi:transposase-like protein